jgi:tRNA dimethylallyltransferase
MQKKYSFNTEKYNALVLLGPTAVGKTPLANRLAEYFSTELISADSRQVYKGLDIGSGKDLDEITVPYHLIDIADLRDEYSVYDYQKDFFSVFNGLAKKNIQPVIVGGTGMYLDAIIRDYSLIKVPTNIRLRESLNGKTMDELEAILRELKPGLHNKTDLEERHRLLRAIEIELYYKEQGLDVEKKQSIKAGDAKPQSDESKAKFKALVLGTSFPRDVLRKNITERLKKRLESGMIEEVENLLNSGISHERLQRLGLEYKFLSLYLLGGLTKDALFSKLNTAIHQFAKRQETWFRGMERKGVAIHWIPCDGSKSDASIEERFTKAIDILYREKYLV